KSLFYYWVVYDVPIGVRRETMGSIVLHVGRSLKMDPEFLAVLEKLTRSRLGLHLDEGPQGAVHGGATSGCLPQRLRRDRGRSLAGESAGAARTGSAFRGGDDPVSDHQARRRGLAYVP